ncbi:isocitrate dehydrogenase [Artemisia annua]|uniref:Isocitrate dehydrogenase n=1 Tax=Artemisia annua TaxID=35608 RepID=A0A2U1P8Q0_ARTAN|nr:isocitrate dehydrogenase [Artemisia annua]
MNYVVPGWTKPICIGRHVFGDQFKATDAMIKGPGKLKMVFVPEGAGETIDLEVYITVGVGGVALSMCNTDNLRSRFRLCNDDRRRCAQAVIFDWSKKQPGACFSLLMRLMLSFAKQIFLVGHYGSNWFQHSYQEDHVPEIYVKFGKQLLTVNMSPQQIKHNFEAAVWFWICCAHEGDFFFNFYIYLLIRFSWKINFYMMCSSLNQKTGSQAVVEHDEDKYILSFVDE